MRRLTPWFLALAIALAVAQPAGARTTLSCSNPTHLTFSNAHDTGASGYGTGGGTIQQDTNHFTNMSVWSPDVRVPTGSTPTTSQTMDICSNTNWNATVTETTNKPPNYPRVVTYPSSEYRFTHYDGTCNWEHPWSYYKSLTSSWAIDAPAKGDWDESYDLWLGDFGGCHQSGVPQIELMTYTKWYQSVFAPAAMANFTTRDGNNFDAWWSWRPNGANGCTTAAGCLYLQTRLTAQASSGTLHLRQIAQALYRGGYTYHDTVSGTDRLLMPHAAYLADIQYGVEVVSAVHTVADGPITFHLTNFSVTAN